MIGRNWGVRYVTAEEAARRIGVHVNTMRRWLSLPRGDWRQVGGRWQVNVEDMERRLAEDRKWRDEHSGDHIAIEPDLRAPLDLPAEPDWAGLPEWIDARTADRLLDGQKGVAADNARRGNVERRQGTGPRPTSKKGFQTRWLYRTSDVRRLWLQRRDWAVTRARAGHSNRFWGPRDQPAFATGGWTDLVDTRTAAAMLGVRVQRVGQLCALGRLPAYQRRPGRRGSRLLIPRRAIEQFVQHAEYACRREMYDTRCDVAAKRDLEPDRDEVVGTLLTRAHSIHADAARREAARARRRAIMRDHGLEGNRAHGLIEEGWEPEEGKITELGFGYRQWSVTAAWPPSEVECRPYRREFGECERDHGEYYSTSQVARLLGVSRAAVDCHRKRGRLPAYQLKKHAHADGRGNWWFFFLKEDVEVLKWQLEERRRKQRRRRAERDPS